MTTSKKTQHALGLYMDGIRDGRPREAVTKYTGERYTQHSTGVADGVEGFVAFFESFVERFPDRDIRVVRSIEDGQYVFCHVSQDLNRGEARWVTMDLFDTDADERIVEHWDVIAPWTDESQVDGTTGVVDLERTEMNKALVLMFAEQVLIDQDHGGMDEHVGDLIQHELGVDDGAAAWGKHLASKPIVYREVFRLIGQGNFVVTYCKVDIAGEPHAVFDVFRLEDGRIVERWVNAEVIPGGAGDIADTGNSGKF